MTVVVLVHGAFADSASWGPVTRLLLDAGHDVRVPAVAQPQPGRRRRVRPALRRAARHTGPARRPLVRRCRHHRRRRRRQRGRAGLRRGVRAAEGREPGSAAGGLPRLRPRREPRLRALQPARRHRRHRRVGADRRVPGRLRRRRRRGHRRRPGGVAAPAVGAGLQRGRDRGGLVEQGRAGVSSRSRTARSTPTSNASATAAPGCGEPSRSPGPRTWSCTRTPRPWST